MDNLSEAQNTFLTLTKHRRSIAPTYNDVLGGQPFDPANLTDLKYVQAMNLQTTTVLAFGLAESIMADGAFMIAAGIAFILVGMVIYQLAKKSAS